MFNSDKRQNGSDDRAEECQPAALGSIPAKVAFFKYNPYLMVMAFVFHLTFPIIILINLLSISTMNISSYGINQVLMYRSMPIV